MLNVLLIKMHLTQLQNGGQGWVFDSNFHSYFSTLIPNPLLLFPSLLFPIKNRSKYSQVIPAIFTLLIPTCPLRPALSFSCTLTPVHLPLPPMTRKAKYSFACFSTFAVHVLNLCHGWMDTHFLSYITMCQKILF